MRLDARVLGIRSPNGINGGAPHANGFGTISTEINPYTAKGGLQPPVGKFFPDFFFTERVHIADPTYSAI